jgi:hypothetical protein
MIRAVGHQAYGNVLHVAPELLTAFGCASSTHDMDAVVDYTKQPVFT